MNEGQGAGVEIASGLIWRLVDDNVVVVSPVDGEVHVLSETGTAVWQLLADKKAVSEIESYLVKHYIVTQEQAHADVVQFLEELRSLGLLV